MGASIVHRGPDQQGTFEDECVSLASVRLKIIDLEGGDQPIRSADGRFVIVFNGEIYNFQELRRELEGQGASFTTHCDTEVVLRAFEYWDTAAFERLRGMFAIALWDTRDQRLILVRDRIGIKPLYLYRRGQDLHFASELKALFAHPEVERRVDPRGLSYYLSLNYVPSPHTLAAGISKLPAGHYLEWQRGRERMEAYWRLKFDPQPAAGLEEAKRELDQRLRESVREHLISDVPLGVWASGGLDSSAVLHYAAELRGSGIETFSVSFRGRSFDESPYFREVAQRYGTTHHEFDLNPGQNVAEAVEELPYFADEPCADAGALPVWFLSKMTRTRVTVALSGEGADELFGGYNTYLADRYAGWLRRLPAALRRLMLSSAQRLLPVSDEKIGLDYKVRRMLEGSLLDPADAHLYWNGTFSLEQKMRLAAINGHVHPGGLMGALPKEAQDAGPLNRFLWLDQMYYLQDDILNKCDRMSMAHSLEVRPPFLDHRLIEFAARLPQNLKIRGSKLKFVLRELMRDKLPQSVLTRRKEGFDIPAHEWLRSPVLQPLFDDVVNERAVRQTGLFRWEELAVWIRGHRERRFNAGYHLWGMLILFLWMRRWGVSGGEAAALSQSRRRGGAWDLSGSTAGD